MSPVPRTIAEAEAQHPAVGVRVLCRGNHFVSRNNWRDLYREMEIVSETRVSWIVGRVGGKMDHCEYFRKVAKKQWPGEFFTNWEVLERQHWAETNNYTIVERIRRLRDYDKLQAILKILDAP